MNKSKLKKGMTAALAAALIAAQAMPAFAFSSSHYVGRNTTEIFEDEGHRVSPGKMATYPGWYWIDQYCYYFDRIDNYAKNTTTPDGYTVDELGRWTVNGVPQTNNYGNVVIGTDQLYAGKSDDERWKVIKRLLEETYANYVYGNSKSLALNSPTNDSVWAGYDVDFGVAGDSITHNSGNTKYIEASMTTDWSDSALTELNAISGTTSILDERIFKILLGDHVGQKLFNDVKTAAEPLGGPKNVLIYDENGNPSMYEDPETLQIKGLTRYIPQSGDGINPALLDLSKWQNRTTDYGKTFSVNITNTGTETSPWYKMNIVIN